MRKILKYMAKAREIVEGLKAMDEETAFFHLMNNVKQLAENGTRVIAISYKILDSLPDDLSKVDSNLTFLGLIGIKDPIRKEVKKYKKKYEKEDKEMDLSSEEDEEPTPEEQQKFDQEVKKKQQKKKCFRISVSAECYGIFNKKEDFVPAVYEKTPEQKESIKNRSAESFMFNCLEDAELNTVIDAFKLVEKNEGSSKASRLLSMFQDLSPEHKKLIEKMIYDYYKTDVIWGGKDSVKNKKSNIDSMRDKK